MRTVFTESCGTSNTAWYEKHGFSCIVPVVRKFTVWASSVHIRRMHTTSSACQCGETCCSDYEHQKPGATNMCHLPKDSLSISCEATNCIYNTNKKCDADHVDISGIKAVTEDDTVCTTFQARG